MLVERAFREIGVGVLGGFFCIYRFFGVLENCFSTFAPLESRIHGIGAWVVRIGFGAVRCQGRGSYNM